MTKPYILAADDEPMNQLILEEMFEGEYELICVDNGLECIESVKNRIPDLILMDINMPDMDGIEATKQIRTFEGCSDIPIIAVSSLASQSEIDHGYANGVSDYVTKPFNDDKLIAQVQGYLT